MHKIQLTRDVPGSPGDLLYVISGRVPGDDEDVTFVLCARDEEGARKAFAESLAEVRGMEVNEMIGACCLPFGDDGPYITCCSEIGLVLCEHEYEACAEDGGALSMSQPVIYKCSKCGAPEDE